MSEENARLLQEADRAVERLRETAAAKVREKLGPSPAEKLREWIAMHEHPTREG